MSRVTGISRIMLICNEPETTALFYERAFGFVRMRETALAHFRYRGVTSIPAGGMHVVLLRLGQQEIELAGPCSPRPPHPKAIPGWSPLFQHFAIVVSDMGEAYARLSAQPGWTAISTHGPERLPASSGGVAAYKFNDPEGHPLELLAFPSDNTPDVWRGWPTTDLCLGIDHSAISVRDTATSTAFYAELGFRTEGSSFNRGPEQERLDAIGGVRVEVTALASAAHPVPHIELLCYRGDFDRSVPLPGLDDPAATRLVLMAENRNAVAAICARNAAALLCGPTDRADGASWGMLRDPDGHLLCIEAVA